MRTKPANRIRSALISLPWAITEDYLKLMLEIAARQTDLQAVEAERGEKLEHTAAVQLRDGVAVIPVRGPICRYMNLFTSISGGTSIDLLARDFNAALHNSQARAILLNIDSPGGEVNGVAEFANMVYAARGQKPIHAYVGGLGASAAYWIASAADEIIVDETALTGSIGVIAAVPTDDDASEMSFVSSQSPRKNPDPKSDDGKADIQATIDALAQVFVEAVARNRGVSSETVLSSFGQGGLFVGKDAVAAGLADRVGSYEQTLADMVGARSGGTRLAAGAPRMSIAAQAGGLLNLPIVSVSAPSAPVPARPHTPPLSKELRAMADEIEEQAVPTLPSIQAPTFNASDPAVAAQVNAVVAQMTAQFEQQRQIVLEQAQAQFQRQLAEMQAQQTIQTYAQHITTPTMQRQHALPLEASAVVSFLSGLSASQRTSAQGLFDRILDAGLVSFEEIGSSGGGDERDAREQYLALVAEKQKTMSRMEALKAVNREYPDLYAAQTTPKGGR